jgi:hypothetical protein
MNLPPSTHVNARRKKSRSITGINREVDVRYIAICNPSIIL